MGMSPLYFAYVGTTPTEDGGCSLREENHESINMPPFLIPIAKDWQEKRSSKKQRVHGFRGSSSSILASGEAEANKLLLIGFVIINLGEDWLDEIIML
ncbi:hypothetical protein Tco_1178074 [Tanacetum coccineum]